MILRRDDLGKRHASPLNVRTNQGGPPRASESAAPRPRSPGPAISRKRKRQITPQRLPLNGTGPSPATQSNYISPTPSHSETDSAGAHRTHPAGRTKIGPTQVVRRN